MAAPDPRPWVRLPMRLGTWALLLAAATLPLQGLRWHGATVLRANEGIDRAVGVLVTDVFLLVAGALGLVVLVLRREVPTRPSRMLGLGLGLLVAGGLFGLLFADHADSGQLFLRGVVAVLVCVLAVWGLAPSSRTMQAIAVAFVGGALLSCCLGLLGALGDQAWAERFESGTGRAIGLAANAGAFATITALALVVAGLAALEVRSGGLRAACTAAFVVLGGGLLASGSRGVAFGVLLLLLVLGWRALRTGRRGVVVGVSGALAAMLVLGAMEVVTLPTLDRLLERPDAVGQTSDRSTTLRLDQLGEEVERRGAQSLLWGSGLRDQEPTEEDLRSGRLLDPHTAHLEVWLGTGLLGFVGWLLVAAATIGPGGRLLARRSRLAGSQLDLAAVSLAYASVVLSALTVNNVWSRYGWLLVAFAAYLSVPEHGARRSVSPVADEEPSDRG